MFLGSRPGTGGREVAILTVIRIQSKKDSFLDEKLRTRDSRTYERDY